MKNDFYASDEIKSEKANLMAPQVPCKHDEQCAAGPVAVIVHSSLLEANKDAETSQKEAQFIPIDVLKYLYRDRCDCGAFSDSLSLPEPKETRSL